VSAKSNKARGARTESQAAKWLTAEYDWRVERIALAGTYDRGDLSGVPGLCIEVKSSSLTTPPWRDWVRQAIKEGRNTGLPWIVLYRPPGRTDVADWIVIAEPPLLGDWIHWCPFSGRWNESLIAATGLCLDKTAQIHDEMVPGVLHPGPVEGVNLAAIHARPFFEHWKTIHP